MTQSKCKFYRENPGPLCRSFYGEHVKPDIFEICVLIPFREKGNISRFEGSSTMPWKFVNFHEQIVDGKI